MSEDSAICQEESSIANDVNPGVDAALGEIADEVAALRDLFQRRLFDDKQKNWLIDSLKDAATFAYIEPFLMDLILLLDRVEHEQSEFSRSVAEELFGILERRGVSKVEVGSAFDPTFHKAVKAIEDESATSIQVDEVVRDGYRFSDRIIRPAEVVVLRPVAQAKTNDGQEDASIIRTQQQFDSEQNPVDAC